MLIGKKMPNSNEKLLVTSALHYANGSLHLGHILEVIQTDIWVRFQREIGRDCTYVCGSDAHGTPIMLQAEKKGITPEKMVADYYKEHLNTLNSFNISFDNYYTTHSEENKELAAQIYNCLKENGDIETKTISQFFDPEKNIFLPDRYVKGECPKCEAKDQYGDSCEVCGSHYNPTDLKNPVSSVSGATPIEKDSLHYFFKLSNYAEFLEKWIKQGHLQEEVANKLKEWFGVGLADWDISRDGPYFGFNIPGEDNKFFYVWMDAPVGYIASFKNLCSKNKSLNFEEYFNKDSKNQLIHFIGKDIVYFHALFWPSMLKGSNLKTPDKIHVHGFLTINGEKMSKSRGTFITADQYLKHIDPEYLRYYFAAKLTNRVDDLDLNLEDFVSRVNADLVGKFVNIASRCAKIIDKKFDNTLTDKCSENSLYKEFIAKGEVIKKEFDTLHFAKAIREIMALADIANEYIASRAPWLLIKDEKTLKQAHKVCSVGINLFRVIAAYLKPVTPNLIDRAEEFLNIKGTDKTLNWQTIEKPLTLHKLNTFNPLLKRLDIKEVEKMLNDNTNDKKNSENNEVDNVIKAAKGSELYKNPLADTMTIDDFVKVDLRIAKIKNAESVPEADKLLKLELDLGGGIVKQVFAGIKAAYNPEELVGKLTVMVANLQPRKMRFGLSEGMVLAAGPGGKDIWLLEPHEGAKPGMRIK